MDPGRWGSCLVVPLFFSTLLWVDFCPFCHHYRYESGVAVPIRTIGSTWSGKVFRRVTHSFCLPRPGGGPSEWVHPASCDHLTQGSACFRWLWLLGVSGHSVHVTCLLSSSFLALLLGWEPLKTSSLWSQPSLMPSPPPQPQVLLEAPYFSLVSEWLSPNEGDTLETAWLWQLWVSLCPVSDPPWLCTVPDKGGSLQGQVAAQDAQGEFRPWGAWGVDCIPTTYERFLVLILFLFP